MAMLVEQVQIVARVLFFQHFTRCVCARSLFESSICLDEKFLAVLLRQMQCGFLIFCAPAGIYHTLVELANVRLSQLFCSARAVLYNFCGLPPPHNDSPLLLQCLVDSSVVVQLTLEDSTVLRLAADEDVPLVLNAQHDEWIEDPPPSDIVQASSAHCCTFFIIVLKFSHSIQVSANLLDTAVACAMRRDGFSVSSNGKLGQPADVAALMKEAQVRTHFKLFPSLISRCRFCTGSRCMVAAAPSFRRSLPTFSTPLHCMHGASTDGLFLRSFYIRAALAGERCDTRLLVSITALKIF
jgi:hypothetical protein